MSQDKRSHVRAASKWREQVARELWEKRLNTRGDGGEAGILDGRMVFDVHAAREHARSLIALEDEQRVFEDWTRAKGLGPENREPGAFDTYAVWQYVRAGRLRDALIKDGWQSGEWSWVGPVKIWPMVYQWRGGWPGKLARQYAWRLCPDCTDGDWHEGSNTTVCLTCDGEQRIRHGDRDPRAPMGRAYARLGRRILDMLDARKGTIWEHAERQPSECPRCTAWGPVGVTPMCPICRGTGHNLRGVLPEVEWSAVVRRKAADGYLAQDGAPRDRESWPGRVIGAVMYGGGGQRAAVWSCETAKLRTVARGKHRSKETDGQLAWHPGRSQICIVTRLSGPVPPCGTTPLRTVVRQLTPRWRRGELRHAEQRRERARARDPIAAAVLAMQPAADEMAEAIGRLGRAAEGSIAALDGR